MRRPIAANRRAGLGTALPILGSDLPAISDMRGILVPERGIPESSR
jgi:hypothetical protein